MSPEELTHKKQEVQVKLEDLIQMPQIEWEKWWTSPNLAFEGRTPMKTLEEDPKRFDDMYFRLNTGMPG